MGRIATHIAKAALLGNKVTLLNCEKVVMTGKKEVLVNTYLARAGKITGRHKGPFWPKRPDNIVRNAIKGMIPKRGRGKEALKRVEVYIGIPKEYENVKFTEFPKTKISDEEIKFISIEEFSKKVGSKEW